MARGGEVGAHGRSTTTRPDRDHPTYLSKDEASPGGPEDGRAVSEEHQTWLDRQVVGDHERVDPGPMWQSGRNPAPGRATGGIARQVVGAKDLGAKTEEATAHDPDPHEQDAVEPRSAW
jgi:hypothetical protein